VALKFEEWQRAVLTMNRDRIAMRCKQTLVIVSLWLGIGSLTLPFWMSAAYAQGETSNPAETVSHAVGTPLKAAQELFKQQKYREALDKLDEVPSANRTPNEIYAIERTRAAIATASGDDQLALKAYLAVVATGRLSADDQLKFIQSIGYLYFRQSDYAQSAAWLERFFKEGGVDAKSRELLVRSYYMNNDFQHAAAELQIDLDTAKQTGAAPTEEQLRVLINLAVKQNDKPAYVHALEQFVTYYPSKKYWTDLLTRLQTRADFSSRLALDFYRLKFSMRLMADASDYMNMAQLSMLAGFPTEAKKVMERGYQSTVLGVGPDSGKQKNLLDVVTKMAFEDSKSMDRSAGDEQKAKDGIGLINLGYAHVTLDQFDTGLAMMEKGIVTPGLKHVDDAKLHLATAYALAGRTERAIEAFKTVQGSDGSADLARYWALQLTHPIP
jgi:hypothetical protein